ncbi:MAG TPA: hypothetical protein VE984_10780 [Gaiellaceae bacterium]|nr:hypothetical protein [Gaiellaceae bacterium]
MKHRFAVLIGVAVLALTLAGSALAHDCMRVSSSPQGLQQSASNGGNWIYFDMTDGGNGIPQILGFFGLPTDPGTVACFQSAYDQAVAANSALPLYFDLGNGVAGGNTNGPGTLAWHNKNTRVLSNGTGIEHFDDTVLPVLIAAAPGCLG